MGNRLTLTNRQSARPRVICVTLMTRIAPIRDLRGRFAAVHSQKC